MANRYALTGNWEDTSTWSDTSGGASGFSVPVATDNVFFDANSGTVSLNNSQTCQNLVMTGYASTLTVGGNCAVTGDTCTFAGTFTNFGGGFTFTGANAGGTVNITSNGKTPGTFTFNGSGKSFSLVDAANISPLTVTAGSFSSNSQQVTAGAITSTGSGTRSLDFSGSTVISSATAATRINLTGSNITFTPPAVYRINPGTTGAAFITNTSTAGTLTFPNVEIDNPGTASYWISFGSGVIITELEFLDPQNAATSLVTFTGNLRIDDCDFPLGTVVASSARGTARTITTNTNGITFTGCIVGDITISGTAIGIGSVDRGNNTNITFQNFGANTHEVVGTTLDNAGDPLPSCDVFLMKRVGNELIQAGYVASDGTTGAYTIGAPDNDPDYVVVATKGSPERGDAMGGITPTVP